MLRNSDGQRIDPPNQISRADRFVLLEHAVQCFTSQPRLDNAAPKTVTEFFEELTSLILPSPAPETD